MVRVTVPYTVSSTMPVIVRAIRISMSVNPSLPRRLLLPTGEGRGGGVPTAGGFFCRPLGIRITDVVPDLAGLRVAFVPDYAQADAFHRRDSLGIDDTLPTIARIRLEGTAPVAHAVVVFELHLGQELAGQQGRPAEVIDATDGRDGSSLQAEQRHEGKRNHGDGDHDLQQREAAARQPR